MRISSSNVRFPLTGNVNGNQRDEDSPGSPGHVEELLLANANDSLQADILKASHHGIETAGTQEFVNAVDPNFVIISASTIHLTPRCSVVARYELNAPSRVILRTDGNQTSGIDHSACMRVEQK